MARPLTYCTVDGCSSRNLAHGLCSAHFCRMKRNGHPLAGRKSYPAGTLCSVDGCDEPRRKLEWCGKHYAMWRRNGNPTATPRYVVAERGATCVVCGHDELMPRSRRYCSSRCQQRAHRAAPPLTECGLCGAPIDLGAESQGRKRRADTRLCAVCSTRRNLRHRYSVRVLAKRDGTSCGICGEPVDMTLRYPDRLAPSVDHVVARADGGSDDPSNLQLAHLHCNSVKQARSHWRLV